VVFRVNIVTPCVSYFWTWILQATYDCIASSGKVFVELTINWSVLSWSAAVGPWSANLVCVTLWSDYCFLSSSFMIVFHSTLGTQRFASHSTWSVDCVHVASALLNCLTFGNLWAPAISFIVLKYNVDLNLPIIFPSVLCNLSSCKICGADDRYK